MIRSWQPGSTGSGRSWTPCWFRISINSSRTPRPPLKAPPRDSRNHLPAPLLKILVENKPGCSPLLTPSNSSRCCQSLHFSLKGKLRPVPQAWAPSVKMQLRWGPASMAAGLLPGGALPSRLAWSGPVEQFSCSCWELTVLPGSRWDVSTLASVPCSQENYNILWTKDHFLLVIIIHRNIQFSKKKNVHILSGWGAEFSKSFFGVGECLLQQQLKQDKCFCGTEIPCLFHELRNIS